MDAQNLRRLTVAQNSIPLEIGDAAPDAHRVTRRDVDRFESFEVGHPCPGVVTSRAWSSRPKKPLPCRVPHISPTSLHVRRARARTRRIEANHARSFGGE